MALRSNQVKYFPMELVNFVKGLTGWIITATKCFTLSRDRNRAICCEWCLQYSCICNPIVSFFRLFFRFRLHHNCPLSKHLKIIWFHIISKGLKCLWGIFANQDYKYVGPKITQKIKMYSNHPQIKSQKWYPKLCNTWSLPHPLPSAGVLKLKVRWLEGERFGGNIGI